MHSAIDEERPNIIDRERSVADSPSFVYNMVAGETGIRRPRCEAFSKSSLLTRLALLSTSGLLGDDDQARATLVEELRRASDAGELPEQWSDQVADLLKSLDALSGRSNTQSS